ncbi:IS630 family transposase, partial [Dysgonomonas sp. 521]|uniref:IS630 family transposase n=1 Tax=Dysgonomonas sp. 521 TaxID=2302932 RepID=UPI0013D6839E
MAIRYKVTLTEEERAELEGILKKGKHTSLEFRNACILLNSDESTAGKKYSNEDIAQMLHITTKTVERLRQRFVEDGYDACLGRKPYPEVVNIKADGDFEAHLIALSCSEAPEGYARWSLRLLADKMVELKYVENVSHETIRQTFKKNEIKPWRVQGWIIPPLQNGDFVSCMERVLDVYKEAYDPLRPVVCMDESPKQLIKETRLPLGRKPGSDTKTDYEYERCGVANIFMVNEPLRGKRHVKVTERKTKVDWAHLLKEIADDYYPYVEKIRLVMDNLNTHKPASLYEAFPPHEAKRIWDRFEFIYTPKHGSWLNMAEIELHVLNSQCLNRRIGDMKTMKKEVAAWQRSRNNRSSKINWQFTNDKARIKLKKLYPTI